MVGVEGRGLVVLAVPADVVLEERIDAVGAVDRPADVLRDIEQDAGGQHAPDVIGLAVVEAAALRLLEAVGGAVPEHVGLDVLPPGQSRRERGAVERGAVIDLVVVIDQADEDARHLVPGPVEPAARRRGRIIPGALVARGVDIGHGVEDERRLGGVTFVAGQGIGVGQVFGGRQGELLDDPGVVGADKIVDAAVGADPAGAGVGVSGVRQDVAVVAGDMAGIIEGGPGLFPEAPLRAADRAAGEPVGKAGALAGHLIEDPGVVLGGPLVGDAEDAVGDGLGPGMTGGVPAAVLDIGRCEIDGRMTHRLQALDGRILVLDRAARQERKNKGCGDE